MSMFFEDLPIFSMLLLVFFVLKHTILYLQDFLYVIVSDIYSYLHSHPLIFHSIYSNTVSMPCKTHG